MHGVLNKIYLQNLFTYAVTQGARPWAVEQLSQNARRALAGLLSVPSLVALSKHPTAQKACLAIKLLLTPGQQL